MQLHRVNECYILRHIVIFALTIVPIRKRKYLFKDLINLFSSGLVGERGNNSVKAAGHSPHVTPDITTANRWRPDSNWLKEKFTPHPSHV